MKTAVIIPCYNEEYTIRAVIEDYQQYFDDIYVIDNNCTDSTVEIATKCGANIITETKQGKGAAIRAAFNEIDADIVVLTEGDSTYEAQDSDVLVRYAVEHDYDMVIGNRLNSSYFNQNQKFRLFGNRLFSKLATKKYKCSIFDLLSGSRVLSKDLYKAIVIKHNGFKLETELTKYAVLNEYNIDFLDINYNERSKDNKSILHIIKDGLKILVSI